MRCKNIASQWKYTHPCSSGSSTIQPQKILRFRAVAKALQKEADRTLPKTLTAISFSKEIQKLISSPACSETHIPKTHS